MNKNISFLIAIAIFNVSLAQDVLTPDEITSETQEVVTIVEEALPASDNISSETEEVTTVTLQAKNVISQYSFKITIQPKDQSETTDFDQKAQDFFNILQEAHKKQNGANLYNKILIFIKELQEAILAGSNLFTAATNTNTNDIIEAAEEVVIQEASNDISQNSDETTSTTNVTKTLDKKSIELNILVSLEKEEDTNLFNSLVVKMNTLAAALNENSHSAEEIIELFNDIMFGIQHLPNTNLTIKIS